MPSEPGTEPTHLVWLPPLEGRGVGRGAQLGGLEFPHGVAPGELDFAYFSFTVGMTFQVSDVSVTGTATGQLLLGQAVRAFRVQHRCPRGVLPAAEMRGAVDAVGPSTKRRDGGVHEPGPVSASVAGGLA